MSACCKGLGSHVREAAGKASQPVGRPTAPKVELLLLRHGATPGNAQHRYVGRGTDEPLSAEGRAQCRRLGVCPDVRTVYTSPLLRARQTAELCFPQARLVPVAGLEEFDFGSFEGKSADEMADDAAYRAWVEGGCSGRCPQGESRAQFVWRTCQALVRLLKDAVRRGERKVYVVAHGGTIMAALSQLAAQGGGPDSYFTWHVGTCEGYQATACVGERVVLTNCHHFTQLP